MSGRRTGHAVQRRRFLPLTARLAVGLEPHAEAEFDEVGLAASAQQDADEFAGGRAVAGGLGSDLLGFQDRFQCLVAVGSIEVGTGDIDPIRPEPLGRELTLGDHRSWCELAQRGADLLGPA
jgi:hypothetical protein